MSDVQSLAAKLGARTDGDCGRRGRTPRSASRPAAAEQTCGTRSRFRNARVHATRPRMPAGHALPAVRRRAAQNLLFKSNNSLLPLTSFQVMRASSRLLLPRAHRAFELCETLVSAERLSLAASNLCMRCAWSTQRSPHVILRAQDAATLANLVGARPARPERRRARALRLSRRWSQPASGCRAVLPSLPPLRAFSAPDAACRLAGAAPSLSP